MDQDTGASIPTPDMLPDQYFENLKKSLETKVKAGRALYPEEERKMLDGFAIEEMTKSAGWVVVLDYLKSLQLGHIDPRGMDQEKWMFAELNAYHASNVANELINTLTQLIEDAHKLHAIKLGEASSVKPMKV